MASIPIDPDDAARLNRALLERLGVDTAHVVDGSVRCETDASGTRVTWTGLAVIDSAEFVEFFNDAEVRPE